MIENKRTNLLKILYFVDSLALGGIQSFFMEYLPRFDSNKLKVEILVFEEEVESFGEQFLKERGIVIHKIKGLTHLSLKSLRNYEQALEHFFKEHHDYQVIELHSSSKNVLVLSKAKKYGIESRIAHAHNTRFLSNGKLDTVIGNLLKIPLRQLATVYFACSLEAGKWMFGKRAVAKGQVIIIKNAVDTEKFQINQEMRIQMREENSLGDELVIGNVGRFTEQKNHHFLLAIFQAVLTIKPEAKLLLVGNGLLEEEIKQKVAKAGLMNQVLFLGFREDRHQLMQAIDVLVCPSLFEGLGIALIEAQATGMVCLASEEAVPKEARVTDLLHFVSLQESAMVWAEKIVSEVQPHQVTTSKIIEAGYDILISAKNLETLYEQLVKA